MLKITLEKTEHQLESMAYRVNIHYELGLDEYKTSSCIIYIEAKKFINELNEKICEMEKVLINGEI